MEFIVHSEDATPPLKRKRRSYGKKKKQLNKKSRSVKKKKTIDSAGGASRRRRKPDIDLTNDYEAGKAKRKSRNRLREKNFIEEGQCSVCFDVLDPTGTDCIVLENCGHSFHEACIVGWLQNTDRKPCPICRQEYRINEWYPCHEIHKKTRKIKTKKLVDDAKKKNKYVIIHDVIDVDPDVIEIE